MEVVAMLWVIGFLLAWHAFGLVPGLVVMIVGPLLAAGLFSAGKSR